MRYSQRKREHEVCGHPLILYMLLKDILFSEKI